VFGAPCAFSPVDGPVHKRGAQTVDGYYVYKRVYGNRMMLPCPISMYKAAPHKKRAKSSVKSSVKLDYSVTSRQK